MGMTIHWKPVCFYLGITAYAGPLFYTLKMSHNNNFRSSIAHHILVLYTRLWPYTGNELVFCLEITAYASPRFYMLKMSHNNSFRSNVAHRILVLYTWEWPLTNTLETSCFFAWESWPTPVPCTPCLKCRTITTSVSRQNWLFAHKVYCL